MQLANETSIRNLASDHRTAHASKFRDSSERRENDASRFAYRRERESYYVFRRGRLEERSFNEEPFCR